MIELIVSDMMCGGCAGTIERAVKAVDGAGKALVDVEGRWVRIESRRPAVRFLAAIAEAGFTPVVWWDGSAAPRSARSA
jgi:copper chaperone